VLPLFRAHRFSLLGAVAVVFRWTDSHRGRLNKSCRCYELHVRCYELHVRIAILVSMDKKLGSDSVRHHNIQDIQDAVLHIRREVRVKPAGPNGNAHQPGASALDLDATIKLTAELAQYDPATLQHMAQVMSAVAKAKLGNAIDGATAEDSESMNPHQQETERKSPSVAAVQCCGCQAPLPRGRLFCPSCGAFQGRCAPLPSILPPDFASYKRQRHVDGYNDMRAHLGRFAARLVPRLIAAKFAVPVILFVFVVVGSIAVHRKAEGRIVTAQASDYAQSAQGWLNARLSWIRSLVTRPLPHSKATPSAPSGNPGVVVWADMDTSLYYCSGTDAYGKTANGRFLNQAEAQRDHLEPALEQACR